MSGSLRTFTLFALIVGLLSVLVGAKNYTIFHHALEYRAMMAEDYPSQQNQSEKQSAKRVDSSVIRYAERIVWAPRYYIFHPSFKLADYLGTSVSAVFPFQIIVIMTLFVGLMLRLGIRFGSTVSNLGLLTIAVLCVSVFAMMNGRAAPAFLGYALLAWAVTREGNESAPLRLGLVSSLGLVLCTTSSGLFIVGFSFFVLSNLTSLGLWLRGTTHDAPVYEDKQALQWINIAISGCGAVYSAFLVYRLGLFYGWDTRFITGIATHGAGELIAKAWPVALIVIAFMCCLMAIFAIAKRAMIQLILNFVNTQRAPVVLTLLPLPFMVVGYTGATLALVGLILLCARAVEAIVQYMQSLVVLRQSDARTLTHTTFT